MKIVKLLDFGRNTVAVVPTMDTILPRVSRLKKELVNMDVDMIAVEDSGPAFNFAKSMNAGIVEALSQREVKYILLSNDDIYDIRGFREMLAAIGDGGTYDYAHPYINGTRPAAVSTRSAMKAIINFSIKKQAPFFARDKVRNARNISGIQHPLLIVPSIFHGNEMISVQPFGLLRREILENCVFDEKFHNGMEDDDLMYRICLRGYRGITDRNWNVVHSMGASFRAINRHERMGSYYGGDELFKKNLDYFCRKHEESGATSMRGTR